ncbi:hypothetical protein DPMN_048366 [Dreissena polymorpha]|uniref:Uncharacterized protein n=1 Tax=Dreissena polymorpha TaxID=45954 RepID=A0A9D4I3X6_DREPO|nr:hypothetical protein DPMN_048366 [Dreissena polymorpha]
MYILPNQASRHTHVSSNLLQRTQYQRVRPKHDTSTCWSTRIRPVDCQPTTSGLVWTRHQERLFVQEPSEVGCAKSGPPNSPQQTLLAEDLCVIVSNFIPTASPDKEIVLMIVRTVRQ